MKKWLILFAVSFTLLPMITTSVFAERLVDTHLELHRNTHNSPTPGKGTLQIKVFASSEELTEEIKVFQSSFRLDETLAAQYVSAAFSDQEFPASDYNQIEIYDSANRDIEYSYTLKDGGNHKHIGGGPELVVTIEIVYNMINATGSIDWSTPTQYFVQATDLTNITGDEDPPPAWNPLPLDDISLPVKMKSYTAVYNQGIGAVLTWHTESELNNEGFHVWRSDAEEGEYIKITTKMIPGHGDSPFVHEYEFVDRNVDEGVNRWYKIEQIDTDGTATFYGPIAAKQLNPTNIPSDLALLQNYPNPFNPTTEISYQLADESSALLKVYNILGEELRTLVNEKQSAGTYTITWDGRDDNSLRLGSGIYIYKLIAGNQVKIRKMLKVE